MLKVNCGTAESKLRKHIGTDHSFCAQRQSDPAEKQNLLSAVPQFTFSSYAIYFQRFPYYQHRSAPSPTTLPTQAQNVLCQMLDKPSPPIALLEFTLEYFDTQLQNSPSFKLKRVG